MISTEAATADTLVLSGNDHKSPTINLHMLFLIS